MKAIQLVELAPAVIRALADGELGAANRAAPVTLTPFFVLPEERASWRRRSTQLESDPPSAGWIPGAIVDAVTKVVVGRAGFHGPPDSHGMVEIAYSVDPAHRRQGYARAALVALLDRAQRDPSVRTARATIRPDNAPSRWLVLQYGFLEVGEQWDEEEGLETIFELDTETNLSGGATKQPAADWRV